jgi:hypothetical protein
MARKKRSTRRRRGGGARAPKLLGKFLPGSAVQNALGVSAGLIGTGLLLSRLPANFKSTPLARAGSTVAIAAGMYALGKSVAPKWAPMLAVGAVTAAAFQLLKLAGPQGAQLVAGAGLSGIGDADGVSYYLGQFDESDPDTVIVDEMGNVIA